MKKTKKRRTKRKWLHREIEKRKYPFVTVQGRDGSVSIRPLIPLKDR